MGVSLTKRAVRCVDATVGIVSNNEHLIREKRYFESARVESLLTNIHQLKEVPYEGIDAEFIVMDDPALKPCIRIGKATSFCAGDFSFWERECQDVRYSLFGNLGLFFRYLLSVLERFHGIYSFHASSFYIPKSGTLLLVMGGPGAGKTVYLLRGLLEGWKIFSTEMTHLQITKDGVEFYKGSLYDNVRVGSLVYDFPEVTEKLGLRIPDEKDVWEDKITVDLRSEEAEDVYRNPRVQIINVRIESGRKDAKVSVIQNKDKLAWMLHKNASEKFATPWLMYERLPVEGCDDGKLSDLRLKTMQTFLAKADLLPVKSILAGVENCLDGIE
ncbi:MAG: hypothetical protein ABIL68_13025 [bacterium]